MSNRNLNLTNQVTLEQSAIVMHLSIKACYFPDWLPVAEVYDHHQRLCAEQQDRLDMERPTSAIPLIWHAAARALGLITDFETGKIIGGPCRDEVGPGELAFVRRMRGGRP
jgi:hypothetical protein